MLAFILRLLQFCMNFLYTWTSNLWISVAYQTWISVEGLILVCSPVLDVINRFLVQVSKLSVTLSGTHSSWGTNPVNLPIFQVHPLPEHIPPPMLTCSGHAWHILFQYFGKTCIILEFEYLLCFPIMKCKSSVLPEIVRKQALTICQLASLRAPCWWGLVARKRLV